MNRERLWPEHVVPGFFHVTWLVLASILLVGADPQKILGNLSEISAGAAVLLGSALLGISVFVGGLVNRLLSDVSSLFGPPQTKSELLSILKKDPEAVKTLEIWWASKCLFRSVMFAIPLIIICAVALDLRSNGGHSANVIVIIGIPLELLTIVAFVTQRLHHKHLRQEILRSPRFRRPLKAG